jgi:two-component system OmpR family response regulator
MSAATRCKRSTMNEKNEGPAAAGIGDVDGHVLVVDDDGQIRQLVAKFLRENGHRVTVARDSIETRRVLATAAIDLIVLDVMLPGGNGFDLCRELRKTSGIPIIMLTARGTDIDRIVGLEIGADDYVAKPFNPRELLARVNAVLRRARSAAGLPSKNLGHRLSFEGWTLDTQRRELTNPAAAVVELSAGEYDLLLTFLEAPQRVLSRDQLMERAKHRGPTGFDRAIDVQVSRLRRRIEPSEESQTMIKTIRGTGYMFVPSVSRS